MLMTIPTISSPMTVGCFNLMIRKWLATAMTIRAVTVSHVVSRTIGIPARLIPGDLLNMSVSRPWQRRLSGTDQHC